MKGISREQLMAAILAAALSIGGLGTMLKMQGDLSQSAKEGKARHQAEREALDGVSAAKPQR